MPKLTSINPANYQKIGSVELTPKVEIDQKIENANKTKVIWKETTIEERIKILSKARNVLFENKDKIAELISKEIGTTFESCKGEVEWDFDYIDWWLQNADKYLSPETTFEDEKTIHEVFYEPIGTVAVITPWNLPFDMFVWGVFPNLIAGNTVIYKAAEECCLTGEFLSKLMLEVGLPLGVFNYINGGSDEGKELVNGNINAIWFTGSSEVGKYLFETSGKNFIRSSLELGGSNPAIVFADADVDMAVNKVFGKRIFNTGQTCDAIKRVIVEESIQDIFVQKMQKKFNEIKAGDPFDKEVNVGPLVSLKQLNTANKQLSESINLGAKILAKGKIISDKNGSFIDPVLLGNIDKNMPVWKEEVFAPILPIMSFKTETEAVELANDTEYGLGAIVFSSDLEKAKRVASKIDAGAIDINNGSHWLPQNPFGGYKNSGFGREHGKFGFAEVTQVKVVSRNKN